MRTPCVKALAEVEVLIEKTQKSKFATQDTWSEVVARLSELESQATAKAEQDELKQLQKRLRKIASDRMDAAIRIRNKNPELFDKFLGEAEAIDPYGEIGRKAGELRAQGSGL